MHHTFARRGVRGRSATASRAPRVAAFAALWAFAAAQTAPVNVTVTPGDGTLTVTWAQPADALVTQFNVTAVTIDIPNPPLPVLVSTLVDGFSSGSTLSGSIWSYRTDTCTFEKPQGTYGYTAIAPNTGLPCYTSTAGHTYAIANGWLNMTTPVGTSFANLPFQGSTYIATSVNGYYTTDTGYNFPPAWQQKWMYNGMSIAEYTSAGVDNGGAFLTSVWPTQAPTGEMHSGFVLFDLASSDGQSTTPDSTWSQSRPRIMFQLVTTCATCNVILHIRYQYCYADPTYGYAFPTSYSTLTLGTANVVLPVQLGLQRSLSGSSFSYSFQYQTAQQSSLTTWFTLPESNFIQYYNGHCAPNNWKIGLFGAIAKPSQTLTTATGIVPRQVAFDYLSVVSAADIQSYTQKVNDRAIIGAYSTARAAEQCSVPRDVTRVVPGGASRSTTLYGVLNGYRYNVQVQSMTVTGARSTPARAANFSIPAPVWPLSTAGTPMVPALALDSKSLPKMPRVWRWQDASGNGRHFFATLTGRQPVGPTGLGTTTQGVTFTGSYYNADSRELTEEVDESVLSMSSSMTDHDMSWFVLYRPEQTPQYAAGILMRKNARGAGSAGWEIQTYGGYYSGYTSGSIYTNGIRIYGSNTAYIASQSAPAVAVGVGVSRRKANPNGDYYNIQQTMDWTADGTPTLLSYNYYKTSPVTNSFRVDGCVGGEGTASCSNTAGQTVWTAGYVNPHDAYLTTWNYGWSPYNYQFPDLASNTATYTAAQVTGWQSAGNSRAKVGDLTFFYSNYYGSYFGGQVFGIYVFKNQALANPTINANAVTDRKIVQLWASDRYSAGAMCPQLALTGVSTVVGFPLTGVPADYCSSSTVFSAGDRCLLSCPSPTVPLFGFSGIATCGKGGWPRGGLTCGRICPLMLSPPTFRAGCVRKAHFDDFTNYTDFGFANAYAISPATGLADRRALFSVPRRGSLEVSLPAAHDVCAPSTPKTLLINNPWYLTGSDTLADPVTVTMEARFRDAGARAGPAARVNENVGTASFDMYRCMFTGGSTTVAIERVSAGSTSTIATRTLSSAVVVGTPYRFEITVSRAAGGSVACLLNGTTVASAGDGTLGTGVGAMHFDSGALEVRTFFMTSGCDSDGNCRVGPNGRCSYTCVTGYDPSGEPEQVCGPDGQWLTTGTVLCVPKAPAIPTGQFVTVREDAPRDAVLGVYNTTVFNAGVTLLYTILPNGNNQTLIDVFGNTTSTLVTGIFGIRLCTGEIFLNTAGVLNFNFRQTFTLNIRVSIAGTPVFTDGQLTVRVLKVRRAPFFAAEPPALDGRNLLRTINENVPLRTAIGPAPMLAVSSEPDAVMIYDIIGGNADGLWAMNSSTAAIVNMRTGLDYEGPGKQPATPNRFNIIVLARDAVAPDLFAQALVEVQLLDVNDPPTVLNQSIVVIEGGDTQIGDELGFIVGGDEDANDVAVYELLSPSSTFKLNRTTGLVTMLRTLAYNPETDTPFSAGGFQVRAVFPLPARAIDTRGAVTFFTLTIYIKANITDLEAPIIDLIEVDNGGVLDPAGGTTFRLRGSFFDTIWSAASASPGAHRLAISTVRGVPFARIYNVTCALPAIADGGASLNCVAPAGWGKDLSVTLFWGATSRVAAATASITLSYAAPTFVGFVPGGAVETLLRTLGGEFVYLQMTSIGSQGSAAAGLPATPISVTYGPLNATARYMAASVVVDWATSRVQFTTVAGVGSDMRVRVTCGDQSVETSGAAGAVMSYRRPSIQTVTVTAVTGNASYTLQTMPVVGGAAFFINGSDFGPLSEAVTVEYGALDDGVVDPPLRTRVGDALTATRYAYRATCNKQPGDARLAHSYLLCTHAPGVGSRLRVSLAVGGQDVAFPDTVPGYALGFSAAVFLAYAPPRITAVTGPGASLADTQGGQVVTIAGANFGPLSFGSGANGAATAAPLSVRYGRSPAAPAVSQCGSALPRVCFLGASCRVTTFDAASGAGTLECVTSPGTGRNHSWAVWVAGQASPAFAAGTNYAPPVVTDFVVVTTPPTGAAASWAAPANVNDYSTEGTQEVDIIGRNFGSGLATGEFAYSVSYRVLLANTRTTSGLALTTAPDGNVTFFPGASDCTTIEAHLRIRCRVVQGVGAGLSWIVVVDSQSSTLPSIAYAPPTVSLVRSVAGARVAAADTDGGDVVVLTGSNFGPRDVNCFGAGSWTEPLATPAVKCYGYVQRVRYGRTGGEYTAADFTVVSDSEIRARLRPGFGANLTFIVTVAGQASSRSAESFDFAAPVIESFTPATAATNPSAASPITITVRGRNFGLLDASAGIDILFGNPGDATLRPRVNVLAATPLRTSAASAAAYLAQPVSARRHSVTFTLPVGLLPGRAVRVVLYARAAPNGYTVTNDPIADGVAFDYALPAISFIAVSNRATSSELTTWIRANVPGVTSDAVAAQAVALTISGVNFGPASTVLRDSVVRALEMQPDGGAWGPAPIGIFSWDHTRVVAYTLTRSARVRIALNGTSFAGAPLVATSEAYSYADLSPSIGAITSGPGAASLRALNTSGGAIIGLNVSYIAATSSSLVVTVGGRICPLTTRDGATLANPLCTILGVGCTGAPPPAWPDYVPGASPPADSSWILWCRVPEGEGSIAPVQIYRDNAASLDGVSVGYAAPTMASYQLWNATASAWGAAVDFTANPAATTLVFPTEPTRMRVVGENFGICPRVVMAQGPPIALGGVVCGVTQDVNVARHQSLEFTTLQGEGTNQLFSIEVGDASISASQTTGSARLNFAPPALGAVASGVSTRGGTITVSGRNFGLSTSTPVISLSYTGVRCTTCSASRRARRAAVAPESLTVPCVNVTRVSATALTCEAPAGSGGGYAVSVTVGGQTSVLAGGFAYGRPRIDAVVLNGTALPLRADRSGLPLVAGLASAGGYDLTLTGANFGAQDSGVHCLFVAWRGRPAAQRELVCDGAFGSAGEGEVPFFAVAAWTHESITFTFPPGAGAREIVPLVRGQAPANVTVAYYAAPSIVGAPSPNLTSTDGGTPMTLSGANFGPATAVATSNATGALAAMLAAAWPADRDEYLTKPRLPAEYLRVDVRNNVDALLACLTPSANDGAGAEIVALRDCATGAGAIISRSPSSIVISTPGGVGRDRRVNVSIVDVDVDGAPLVFTSNSVLFSYAPPFVRGVDPWPVRTRSEDSAYLTFRGDNFGRRTASWTAAELNVSILVSGTVCANAQRRDDPTAETQLLCELPPMTVGFKTLTYTVAGQTGTSPATAGSRTVYVVCEGGTGTVSDPGFFGFEGETCLPCPRGATCAGWRANATNPLAAGTLLAPRPLPTWFNLNGSMYEEACPPAVRPVSGNRPYACIVRCEPQDACLGDNRCAAGYVSKAPYYACASCADGYYKRANDCVKCPDSPFAVVIIALVIVAAVFFLMYMLNKKQINIGYIAIGVDFFQVIAIFAQSKVKWPQALKDLFNILSAFNLNIEIISPECFAKDVTYKQKWGAIIGLPVALCAFALVLHGLYTAYKFLVLGRRRQLQNHSGALISVCFMFFYILYIYLVRTILDVFNCAPRDPDDGKLYLSAVFEECGIAGGTQMTLLGPAIAACVFYIAGYPLTVGYLLWKNREAVMEDQLLRAKGTGKDRLTNPRAYDLRKRYRNLYYAYKPDFIFWVLAVLLRKFLLAVTYVMFNKNSSFQLAAALLVMFLAYAAQVRFIPYMSPGEYDAVLREHELAAATSPLHARLKESIARIESRGRKRAHKNVMAPGSRLSAGAALSLLSGWLFNYNTVEAVLLFAAVIVALMGIMFAAQDQADYASYYREARDAITAVAFLAIIVSIVYIVVVIVVEIGVLWTEEKRKEQLERRMSKTGKKSSSDKDGKAAAERRARDSDALLRGPVETANNPLFTSASGGMAGGATGVKEAILATEHVPSVELWRLFQSAYISLQDEAASVSRSLTDTKWAAQRLEAAVSLIAASGLPAPGHSLDPGSARSEAFDGSRGAAVPALALPGPSEPSRRSAPRVKQEFGPTAAGGKVPGSARGAGGSAALAALKSGLQAR